MERDAGFVNVTKNQLLYEGTTQQLHGAPRSPSHLQVWDLCLLTQRWAERDPSPGGIPQCREEWQKPGAKMPSPKQFQPL